MFVGPQYGTIHVTILAPRILMWFLNFSKIYAPLLYFAYQEKEKYVRFRKVNREKYMRFRKVQF
jgi:hypothetical protein